MLKNYLSKLLAVAVFMAIANYSFAQYATVTVTSPAGIAGDYYGKEAAFGAAWSTISGTLVLVDDGMGASTSDGCEPIINDVAGKIALIDRGTCSFAPKAANAEAAGAIAVVVCNTGPLVGTNGASPYVSILMGNTAPPTTVNIPVLMLSYYDCEIIKTGLPGVEVTINSDVPAALPGERCENPIAAAPGTYTVDSITTGLGSIFGSGHAVWYAYTPSTTTLATASSCGGTDSRLFVGLDCTINALVATGDDDCPDGNGDVLSAEASWLAVAGTTYYIAFDDRWTQQGFDWTLSESSPPNVNVTFTVDMQFTAVDPAGAYIAGTFNSWTPEPMTDNGDGTYSFTAPVQAGTEVQWKFLNGPNGWETSQDLADCGVPDGSGGFNRAFTPLSLDDVNLGTVCFNSCQGCVPTDCADPIEIIDDNLDSYTTGALGPQAAHWTTWSGTEGGAEDATVTTDEAESSPNSFNITGTAAGGGPQDVVLKLGNKTSGRYILSWDMFIPAGFGGYNNIQKTEVPGTEWAYNLYFEPNGIGSIDAGVASAATFSHPHDEWFKVLHIIDLDNDNIELYVNNRFVFSWPFTNEAFATGGLLQLGSVDFFPIDTQDKFYIDNVYFAAIPPVGPGENCSTAIPIDVGTHTVDAVNCFGGPDQENAPGSRWYSYTPTEDGFIAVQSCGGGEDTRVWIFSGDCGTRGTTGLNDDECEMSAGSDEYASYRETAVTAGTTYYIVWDNRWSEAGFDFNLAHFTDIYPGDFCQTALEATPGQHTIDYFGWAPVAGPQYGAFSTYTSYVQSKWYTYTPAQDETVRVYSCGVANVDTRVWVYTGDCSTFESLTLVGTSDDDCGSQSDLTWEAEAGTTYYIEWDDYQDESEGHDWVMELIIPTVDVTFRVDLGFATPDPAGVFIAGNFNGWSDEAMTNTSGTIWEITKTLEVGDTVLYKFKNGPSGWESSGNLEDCGINDGSGNINRFVEVPDTDVTLDLVCFNFCVACDEVDTKEEAFAAALGMNPNPANSYVNLTYNFKESTDLNIRLTNTLGQVLLERSVSNALTGSEKLDLSTLPSGAYMVVLSNGDSIVTKRLIVE